MPRLVKQRKFLAAGLLLVLIAGTSGWWWSTRSIDPSPVPVTAASITFGGPFTLTDHTGRSVSERDYLGYFTLVFFGFTACPDVCPTTLQNVASTLNALGGSADKVRALFVTVDPDRDTPQAMANYVGLFDPRIVGLTGAQAQISQIAKAYRVYYRKADDKNAGYLMEHTAVIFLMGPDGKYLAHIPPDMPPKRAAEMIRQHMEPVQSQPAQTSGKTK